MMATERPAVLTGGCQCGSVRYALYAFPKGTHICHCRMCQKATAGPFAALAPARLNDFAWTRGTPAAFLSSSEAARDFCAGCGTPLTFRYLDSAWVDVTIGSLDEPEKAPPLRHYGSESRLPWFETITDLPGTTTGESMQPERQKRLVSYQHPDHDTPADWQPPQASGPTQESGGGERSESW